MNSCFSPRASFCPAVGGAVPRKTSSRTDGCQRAAIGFGLAGWHKKEAFPFLRDKRGTFFCRNFSALALVSACVALRLLVIRSRYEQ
ncbi:hypothetical protein GCWU000246_00095 [Jonquetella anthropi E3_33 E1]|nr:hypothetical protein GCWU000246_00095 [Jonquetella anthropi E3_33 E1]